MMLEKYRDATGKIEWWVAECVCRMLKVKPKRREKLFQTLDRTGHDQADLVLCLLRLDCRRHVEALIGHEIYYCPRSYRTTQTPLIKIESNKSLGGRRVISVAINPRLPSTDAYQRYQRIRVGLSVNQLRVRGVRLRDIRWAVRNKHVRLSA